jgi:NADH dehydrogenase
MKHAQNRHRVVIVGGGAGGLELATRLGDRLGHAVDITLVDRNRTHVWKPKLHEIAAGSMDLAVHEVDYLSQAHRHRFRYRVGEMIGLDRERRHILVAPSLRRSVARRGRSRNHAAARARL